MFKKIIKAIENAENILIPLHILPDGDSVGSASTLEIVAKNLNKKVRVISYHKVPEYLTKVVDTSRIIENFDYENDDYEGVDLILIPDIAEPKLVTEDPYFKLPADIKKICIDHHPSNEGWGDINLIDSKASATCTILFRELKKQKLLTEEMFPYIATGIITDTGSFKNFNTTAEDFEIMAALTKGGLKINELLQKFLFKNLDDIKYKSIIYTNAVLNEKDKYIYSYCTKQNIKDAGLSVDKKYAGGIPDIRFIDGADFAFFLKEKNNKGEADFSVSLRSIDPEIDVSKIAEKLGGGGHKVASGGIIRNAGTIENALAEIEGVIHLMKNKK